MALPSLNIVRDEFKFMTLLYTGAFIQALFFVVCPHRIVALPAILVIFCSVAKNLLQQFGLLPGKTFSDLRKGRWTAQLVNADGSIPESGDGKGKSVVVFLLGARSNSATMGRFAPGFSHVSELISDMWRDAITNKATSGYLGKTSTLVGTDDENCNVMIWISYWKSIEHPQRFANGDSHRKGWDSYLRGEHPHLGIMHETYDVPAGNWETICHNFTQFGLGKTEQLINPDPEVKPDSTSKENYTSSLVEAKGASWKSNDKASFGIPGITLGNRPVPLHPDDW